MSDLRRLGLEMSIDEQRNPSSPTSASTPTATVPPAEDGDSWLASLLPYIEAEIALEDDGEPSDELPKNDPIQGDPKLTPY